MADRTYETLGEARERLREAALEQSRFLDQHGERERALARLIAEVHRWPESEQAQLLEVCRRDLERERQVLDNFKQAEECSDDEAVIDVIADIRHVRRAEKLSAMQARVDEARAKPDDNRTREEIQTEALEQVEQQSEVLSRPMRIQNLFQDAAAQEWKIERHGAFSAYPEGGALHAAPNPSGGWYWTASREGAHATGTASSPAIAVASAEAAYHLMRLG
jgi:hypothetical protein